MDLRPLTHRVRVGISRVATDTHFDVLCELL
jgi:hypothetical protein